MTVTVTKDQLLEVLEVIKRAIVDDDSAGGSLTYAWGERGMFEVTAVLRTGNSEGQGGVMLL